MIARALRTPPLLLLTLMLLMLSLKNVEPEVEAPFDRVATKKPFDAKLRADKEARLKAAKSNKAKPDKLETLSHVPFKLEAIITRVFLTSSVVHFLLLLCFLSLRLLD